MRASPRNYLAEKARQGEIILKRPWQKIVFFAGLAVPVLLLLIGLLFPAAWR